jgi:excisionase family DNA binding protein
MLLSPKIKSYFLTVPKNKKEGLYKFMEHYITIRQAAEALGVSEATIRNFLLKDHLFKGKRFGRQIRIEKDSFQEFVRQSEIQ